MQGEGEGAGIGAEAGGEDHEGGPDQFGDGAQGIQQQAGGALHWPAEASGGGQGEGDAEDGGEQGAEGGHGEGFEGAVKHRAQVADAEVGAEETLHVGAHLFQAVGVGEFFEVEAQVAE